METIYIIYISIIMATSFFVVYVQEIYIFNQLTYRGEALNLLEEKRCEIKAQMFNEEITKENNVYSGNFKKNKNYRWICLISKKIPNIGNKANPKEIEFFKYMNFGFYKITLIIEWKNYEKKHNLISHSYFPDYSIIRER